MAHDQTKQAMVAEIYNSLTQLIDAYERVMDTFGSVVGDVVDMQSDIRDIEKFVNEQFVNAVTGRNLWKANAKIHREAAEKLRVQLRILRQDGCKLEAEVPIVKKVKKQVGDE